MPYVSNSVISIVTKKNTDGRCQCTPKVSPRSGNFQNMMTSAMKQPTRVASTPRVLTRRETSPNSMGILQGSHDRGVLATLVGCFIADVIMFWKLPLRGDTFGVHWQRPSVFFLVTMLITLLLTYGIGSFVSDG